jgi:hypothetical protein
MDDQEMDISREAGSIQEYDVKTGSEVPVVSKENFSEWITSWCIPF